MMKFILILLLPLFAAAAGTGIVGPTGHTYLLEGQTLVVSAAGTTTLTVNSETNQIVSGATTQIFVLPDATTLKLGRLFRVSNRSTGTVTVNKNGGALSGTLKAGEGKEFRLTAAGSAAGTWDVSYLPTEFGGDLGAGGSRGLVPAPAAGDAALSKFLAADGNWGVPAGAGTVTSVALAVPAELSVSGSPVTGAGTITISKVNQNANTVYAGPTSGSSGSPSFRALVLADVPKTAITTNRYTSGTAATYTTPAGTFRLHIKMIAGGGGGAGAGGSTSSSNGGGGSDSLWKDSTGATTYATAVGGSGGTFGNATPIAGGGGSVSGGPTLTSLYIGGGGSGVEYQGSLSINTDRLAGGNGGNSCAGGGGAGGGGVSATAGQAGAANSGSGGGGGSIGNQTDAYTGQPGSAGGCIEFDISSPAASYQYTVGAAGSNGGAGTSPAGGQGGTGAAGVIEVTAYPY